MIFRLFRVKKVPRVKFDSWVAEAMTNREFAELIEKFIATGEADHGGAESKSKLSLKVIQKAILGLKRSPGEDLIANPAFDELPAKSAEWLLGEQILWFDSLAKKLRDRHRQKLNTTCGSTFIFLVLFAVYAHLLPRIEIFGVGCVFLAYAAYTVQFEGRKNHHAFLFARATCEVLRTYFFLAVSGIQIDLPSLVHRRYRIPLNSVLSCAQMTIKNSESQSEHLALDETVVSREWFVGQQEYYATRSKSRSKLSRTWFLISRISIAIGLVFIFTAAILIWRYQFEVGHKGGFTWSIETFTELALTLGPILLSAGAVSEFYREKLGFEHLAERYKNSILIYQSNSDHGRVENLTDVGTQAIHEIIDWYVASVEREISVPLG